MTRLEEKEARRQARIERERKSFFDDFDDYDFDERFGEHFNRIVGVTKLGIVAGLIITVLVIACLAALLIALL